MTIVSCAVADCERPTRTSRNPHCNTHAARLQRTGSVMAEVPIKEHRLGCTVDGCDRKHYSFGLCELHRDRVRAHGDAGADRPVRLRKLRKEQGGTRWCHTCEQWLPISEFWATTSDCSRCRQLRNFNMTRIEWEALFAAQGSCCAICGANTPLGNGWHTDHDHGCCPERGRSCGQCVRGILCSGCNTGIGLLGDDSSRLRAAADYLERSRR